MARATSPLRRAEARRAEARRTAVKAILGLRWWMEDRSVATTKAMASACGAGSGAIWGRKSRRQALSPRVFRGQAVVAPGCHFFLVSWLFVFEKCPGRVFPSDAGHFWGRSEMGGRHAEMMSVLLRFSDLNRDHHKGLLNAPPARAPMLFSRPRNRRVTGQNHVAVLRSSWGGGSPGRCGRCPIGVAGAWRRVSFPVSMLPRENCKHT